MVPIVVEFSLLFISYLVDFLVAYIQLKHLNWIWLGWILGLACIYILARLFVLVEIFRTLYLLPPEAFLTTWSASIPHLG